MGWQTGNQIVKPHRDLNEELLKLPGDLDDNTARATLAQFFEHNLGFTVELMSGVQLAAFQEMTLRAWFNRNFNLCVWGRGVSKCVRFSNNQKVITKKDGMIGIRSLLEDYCDFSKGEHWADIPETLLWNGNSWQTTNKVLIQPKKPVWKLTTKRGYEIEVAPTHRMKFLNRDKCKIEWIRVGEADFDKHYLCVSRNKCDWGEQKLPQKELDEAYLVGLLVGDGCVTQEDMTITSADKEICDFSKKFNCRIRNKKNIYCIGLKRKLSKSIREKYGLGYHKSYTKHVPQKILASSELTREFLRGLFDTDGSVATERFVINFCSVSKELVSQVHDLLSVFGVISNLKERKTDSKFGKAYVITISGENSYKFTKEIGFRLSRKQDQCLIHISKGAKLNTNVDVIYGAKEFFQKHVKSKYRLTDLLSKKWRNNVRRKNPKENVSYSTLNKYLDFAEGCGFDDLLFENLIEIQKENFFFDPVVSVEKFEDNCIDFNVPNGEMYWSNGFINHNSWTAAVFCWLYPIFNRNTKIVIASSNFRTSRRIFIEMEKMINSKEGRLLEQCFSKKYSKRSDQWEWEINGGSVSAIPLSGERIRGIRANVLILDEFLLLPQQLVDEVLIPFLSSPRDLKTRMKIRKEEDKLIRLGKMKEEDRLPFENTSKMICLSSASYTFEHLYTIYEKWSALIDDPSLGDKELEDEDEEKATSTYFVSKLAWDAIPEFMMDKGTIKLAKEGGGSNASFLREYCARFIDGGEGYYSPLLMNKLTIPDGESPTTKIKGDSDKEYVLGIDPDFNSSKTSDYFAMSLGEIQDGGESIVLVNSYQKAAGSIQDRYKYLYYLLTNFNIKMIVGDNAGIERFIEAANGSSVFAGSNKKIKFFDFDSGREGDDYKQMLIEAKKQYNPDSGHLAVKFLFNPANIRRANEYLRSCMDHKRVWFASKAAANEGAVEEMMEQQIPLDLVYPVSEETRGDSREHTEKLGKMDFMGWQDFMIKDTKEQCAIIEVTANSTGAQTFDMPLNLRKLRSENRPRKDNYSSFMLMNWGFKILKDLRVTNQEKPREMIDPVMF